MSGPVDADLLGLIVDRQEDPVVAFSEAIPFDPDNF